MTDKDYELWKQDIDFIRMLREQNEQLEKENQKYKEVKEENEKLKDKLSKIETLIINHNCDTGDLYYKYNSRFLKSELKQRLLEIVYEQETDSNE